MQPLANTDGQRILAVDDDPAILELITTRLTLAGYQAFAARDGRQAVERIEGIRPAAMILDLNMPVLDGFGVLQHLRDHPQRRVPTLVLTARHGAADVQRALGLGARDYLAKPFEDRKFLMRVSRLLRKPSEIAQKSNSDVFAEMDALMADSASSARSRPVVRLPDLSTEV